MNVGLHKGSVLRPPLFSVGIGQVGLLVRLWIGNIRDLTQGSLIDTNITV